MLPFTGDGLEAACKGALLFEPRGASGAGSGMLALAPAQFGHSIPKFLAIHVKHLAGFHAPNAGRTFLSWFNFSSSRARARCKRERTVPIGQPSASAASA